MRKSALCVCKNKDTDQLRSNREADQHLCFRYTDSTIPLQEAFRVYLNKFDIVVSHLFFVILFKS